jgi:hypothetical protein
MTMTTPPVKFRGRSATTLSPPVGTTHDIELTWIRLRVWLGVAAGLALVATLALTWWGTNVGGEAVLSSSWPLAVGTVGVVWVSGVIHGRRVILLTFLLGYLMLPILLVGETSVWWVVGYALFTGGQVWNLVALCRATPLGTSGVSHPRKG